MHNQHALPGLLYARERKKKAQMPSENCLSSGNIDRPLITVARHAPPDATAQFLGPVNNSRDGGGGEGGSNGQPRGSRFSRSPTPLNTLPSLGAPQSPNSSVCKAGSQEPFYVDAHSSTPRNTRVPWTQRTTLRDSVVPSLKPLILS